MVITEASVTKAAVKLDMSQSAMSYSLKKLRLILEDDILIRTSREMEVTPYAQQIGDRIFWCRYRMIFRDITTKYCKITNNLAR